MAGTEGRGEAPQNHGFLQFDGEDGSSTIYHVPSFLLKTYEIVDVRIIRFYYLRIRNMITLWLGRLTENLSLSKNRMNSQRLFFRAFSSIITFLLSLDS